MKRTAVLAIAVLVALGLAQAQKDKDNDPDQKELHDYVLTMDKVQKAGNATKAMQEVAKKHPEMEKDNDGDAKNLDEMVAKIQKYPEVTSLLRQNGLTAREYAVCTFTLMQAAMAVGFKKAGTYKEYPPKMLAVVSKQNLDFVEQHFDEIKKMMNME